MNYVYKNITASDARIIIARSNPNAEYYVQDNMEIIGANIDSELLSTVTIHKCDIANVDSSDAVVDVYLETFNLDKTFQIYGTRENGNYNTATVDYKNKSDLETYYKIKSVTIPVGATLSLFTDHPCTHSSKFNFIIKSTQAVDVIIDYDFTYVPTRGERVTNRTNQY